MKTNPQTMKTIFDIGPVNDRPEPALAGFRATDTGFHWPHLLVSGDCTECPGEFTGWVYRVPKTRVRLCKDCLIACAADPDADPVLAALGREIAYCRSLPSEASPQSTDPKPSSGGTWRDAAIQPRILDKTKHQDLDIADGRFCTDCGRRGPTWKVEATCDQFCLACTDNFIQWQEGELRAGYAAYARLSRLPLAEKRPYRLLKHRPCYQIAACEAG